MPTIKDSVHDHIEMTGVATDPLVHLDTIPGVPAEKIVDGGCRGIFI